MLGVDDAARTVTVAADLGDCRQLRGSRTDATGTAVTIAVLATPPPSGLCTMRQLHAVAVVVLDQRLGVRALRHAPLTGG